ncbi:hypothetical protein COEREDRAFT_14120 [Coemansia reversa NRRL 1564]|uniref:Zn(2)-C6 fungal-type domain-containing protein n=1 Tax=Coemansia reversa (strain ATCC 12441 / NRRL 1564) TaxID=763665 RepID=A0A2G5BH94_COERN|nr:hypothetical protein COEREDRAFT_14120 [Coemansia reversa NRRL 1564]|eukprot:PIA18097.1 hypothetical protein COEREDRAFT_14120 [Coemansia reversa NRRL 1564]
MSQYLHISSLLNIGEEQSGPATPPRDSYSPKHMAHRPVLSQKSRPLHVESSLPLPSPAHHSNSTHAVRDQSVYTMHDYRYWPYIRQGAPGHPSLAVPRSETMADETYASFLSQNPYNSCANIVQRYAHWHRQRRTRACHNCHLKKVRCEGGGTRCVNCVRAGVECKWIPMKKRGPKPKPKPTETESLPASSSSSAVNLPLIGEQHGNMHSGTATTSAIPLSKHASGEKLGLGLGLEGEIEHVALSHSHKSRQSSATTVAASPLAIEQHQLTASPTRASTGDELRTSPTLNDEFAQLVKESDVSHPKKSSSEDTLRRFYSNEVSEDTRNAIIYYFEYFYSICPIFHPSSFLRRVVAGDVDPILISSMRASAARYINKYTGSSIDLDKLIEDINSELLVYLDEPNLDYVRAVVIMASLNGGECRFMMYNTLTCLASNLVMRLGWHMLDSKPIQPDITWEEWINVEIKRRTLYVVYQIDGYLALLSDRFMALLPSRLLVLPPGSSAEWDNIAIPRLHDSLPTYFNGEMSASDIIKSGSLTHSFISLCSLTTIISRVNNFLWKIKLSLSVYPHGDGFKPNVKYFQGYAPARPQILLPIRSLFDIEEFRNIHQELRAWQRKLVNFSDIKHNPAANRSFSTFGSYSHRLHLLRIRYFCLYMYSVPVIHCLHFANRPSYFETQGPTQVFASAPDTTSLKLADAPENKLIYEIMSGIFADRQNRGLLAYDIVEDSWNVCLEIVYDLVRHLDSNNDMPLERHDQVMPLCLLSSMTVLIRNVHICRHIIEKEANNKKTSKCDKARKELKQSTTALKRLWSLLGDLNKIWRVDGVENLLRMMQVEEVVKAADLLSGMKL